MYIDKENKVIVFSVLEYAYTDTVKLKQFKQKLIDYVKVHNTVDKCSLCNLRALCFDTRANTQGLVLNLHRYNALEIKVLVHAVERTIAQVHDYACKGCCYNCKFKRFCNDMLLLINYLQSEEYFKEIIF